MGVASIRKRRYPYRYNPSTGEYEREKRIDEVLNDSVEFFQDLDPGETLSSVTVEVSGPTITAETIASGQESTNTKVTFTVTCVGAVTFKVVTSASRTLERLLRFRGTDYDLLDYHAHRH